MPSTSSSRTAWALLGGVVLFWGANWPIMKIGVQHMGPMSFGALRMALAALCMMVLLAALRRLHWPKRGDWPIVIGVGTLQMAAFVALTTIALGHVDAGRSAILAYTTPIWVIPGAMLLFGERLTPARLTGLAFGLVGVGIMLSPGAIDWSDRDLVVGNGLLMLAALVWATQILLVKAHRWESPPLDLAFWQFIVATLILAPVALLLEGDRPIVWDAVTLPVLAFNGPIATAFCFWAVVQANQTLPAMTTSLALLAVPVWGLGSSVLFLGETLDLPKLLGLALIVIGVVTVALGERRAERR
jgi:drug/metabolite transporter (DMT)-like permease